jgi:nucleotide-binding universal stress UspA family protein
VGAQPKGPTLVDPLARSAATSAPALSPPVLIAIDGGASTGAVVRIANAIASRSGGVVDALVVEPPFPAPVAGVHFNDAVLEQESIPPGTRLGHVRDQLRDGLRDMQWGLHVEFGRTGPTIARAADESGARLIILGLGRAHSLPHFFRETTAERVLHHSGVPVLAVSTGARGLPHTAVVAIDFSPASVQAALVTRDLLEPPASLCLVHVRTADDQPASDVEGWGEVYDAGVAIQLERLGERLARPGVRVHGRIDNGPVARAILQVALENGADLIACGAHSAHLIDRWLLGSVAARLLRTSACSVLVAPSQRTYESEGGLK